LGILSLKIVDLIVHERFLGHLLWSSRTLLLLPVLIVIHHLHLIAIAVLLLELTFSHLNFVLFVLKDLLSLLVALILEVLGLDGGLTTLDLIHDCVEGVYTETIIVKRNLREDAIEASSFVGI
jgi:hypothetical protein